MSEFEKDAPMAVSPISSYLNSSAYNVSIMVVFESQIPIDESKVMQMLGDVFVPLNKRFSSIMKQWKQVDVNLKEHMKIPIFAKKGVKFYDEEFDEYMSKIGGEKLAQDKPLWEVHLIKYPTRKNNAAGTSVVKLHHSLGDGYTLMGSLLSCVKRVDDPSIPITFPSSHATTSSIKRLPESIFSMFKSASDFGWNILRGSNFIVDDQSPIRPENKEFKHGFGISNVTLSLDSFKVVKNKLKVTTNDTLVGMIFLGISLYMEAKSYESRKTQATAIVMLNARKIRAYKSVEEMLQTNSDTSWGNRFHSLQLPIPKLSDANTCNPLDFVLEAHKIIIGLRNSSVLPLSGLILRMLDKIKGTEAAAKHAYKTVANSSVIISNVVGPVEQVALANHPIKRFYFTATGLPTVRSLLISSSS
ncbi:O-acyltransferase [Arachis hypogaea]|nr:O-acyltransferase [Arachis hypogaea]